MTGERYYVQRRAGSASTLRWDRGSVLWMTDHRTPQLVTREVADDLAATYGGVVAEVDA
jgi:hypothetical protein